MRIKEIRSLYRGLTTEEIMKSWSAMTIDYDLLEQPLIWDEVKFREYEILENYGRDKNKSSS